MIKGTGLDLTELDRIRALWDKYGSRFAQKILTPKELAELPEADPVPRLAVLFAAKEAAVKALGTGFSQGIHFKCMEILHDNMGRPHLTFLGAGLEACAQLQISATHVSLTHSRDTAGATVILEG